MLTVRRVDCDELLSVGTSESDDEVYAELIDHDIDRLAGVEEHWTAVRLSRGDTPFKRLTYRKRLRPDERNPFGSERRRRNRRDRKQQSENAHILGSTTSYFRIDSAQ